MASIDVVFAAKSALLQTLLVIAFGNEAPGSRLARHLSGGENGGGGDNRLAGYERMLRMAGMLDGAWMPADEELRTDEGLKKLYR